MRRALKEYVTDNLSAIQEKSIISGEAMRDVRSSVY